MTTTDVIEKGGVDTITLTINGNEIKAKKGTTVLEAALAADVYIPTLCYDANLSPYGACRLCIVEIEGMRGLPTSCTTEVKEGMVVHTETEKVNQSRRIAIELIMANHNGDCLACAKNQQCELQKVAKYLDIEQEHFDRMIKRTNVLPIDASHPAIIRDYNKCILCGRCWRTCQELVGANAIDVAFRGYDAKPTTLGDKPLTESPCESCGECIAHCPTGALTAKNEKQPTKEVKTTCPYCGVGCSIYMGIRNNQIVSIRGDKDNPVNQGGLCVKGRFGFDFIQHPDRLTKPLIRKEGRGKDIKVNGNLMDVFREATWEEALDLVAQRLTQIKGEHGADSLGVLSSAKFTNEENYVVQKFARAVLGTNNVDHCARLCHASTVVGAIASFGSGAMSNSIEDIAKAELLFIIGSNTTECHPIIGRVIRQRRNTGDVKLVVADPRTIDLAKRSDVYMPQKPGSDVALLNGMMSVIVAEDLYDKEFVKNRTEGFEELKEMLKRYTPELAEEISGVPKEDIIRAARMFAKAKTAAILYGMGITQHTTGTDNVKTVANLLMLTGNMGKEGCGFSPLRGQNNVQGACDLGALPNVYPGYQKVSDADKKQKFETAWGVELSDKPGMTVTEMMGTAHHGKIKAMYVAGENIMMSEPHLSHVKEAVKGLEFMVVEDIFPTETAVMADVILPASAFAEKTGTYTNTERRVQMVRKAVNPPGECKTDWQIISEVAKLMGYDGFDYKDSAAIMDEIASLTPIYGGMSHERLEEGFGLQWPCPTCEHPGTPILHVKEFACGKGRLVPVEYRPPAEAVSEGYPLILTTGRMLEHWHTGTMSRRSEVLDKLHPNGFVEINPDDAVKMGITDGDMVTLFSERGKIETPAKITDKVSPGLAFMAFHWTESPANVLTNPALDPAAKIPEFKVAAIKAVLSVLDRAAQDNDFFTKLAENPADALREYNLTEEEKSAIMSGDIRKIESWVGKLDDRLRDWLIARLSQEKW